MRLFRLMKKKLVPLAEHNARILAPPPIKWPSGIACPQCSEELLDLMGAPVLQTSPAQCPVRCSKCTWKGHRYMG